MQFLGQIVLDENVVKQLALIFMCQNDPGMCSEWDPNLGGNSALLVGIDQTAQLARPPETGVTVRGAIYGARVVVVDSGEYDDAKQRWADENRTSGMQILGMFGNDPSWIQDDETPTCDACGGKMRFVAQLEEGPDHKTAMNFGGGGLGYLFDCSCPERSAKFLWQC